MLDHVVANARVLLKSRSFGLRPNWLRWTGVVVYFLACLIHPEAVRYSILGACSMVFLVLVWWSTETLTLIDTDGRLVVRIKKRKETLDFQGPFRIERQWSWLNKGKKEYREQRNASIVMYDPNTTKPLLRISQTVIDLPSKEFDYVESDTIGAPIFTLLKAPIAEVAQMIEAYSVLSQVTSAQ